VQQVTVDDVLDSNATSPATVLTVSNPDPIGCSAHQTVFVVPMAVITSVFPPILFVDLASQPVVVLGSNFIVVDGVPPTVLVQDTQGDLISRGSKVIASNCTAMAADAGVQLCTQLNFTLPSGGNKLTPLTLSVQPPDPISDQCAATFPVALLAAPSVSSVSSPVVCVNDTFTFTGTFYHPTLTGGVSGAFALLVDNNTLTSSIDAAADVVLAGCTMGVISNPYVDICTQLSLAPATYAKYFGVPGSSGFYQPAITLVQTGLPTPGRTPYTDLLTVLANIDVTTEPTPGVCTSNDTLTFIGTGFAVVNGTKPSVSLTVTGMSPRSVDPSAVSLAGCSNASAPAGSTLQLCTSLSVEPGDATGSPTLVISNPPPLLCNYTLSKPLVSIPKPVVTAGQSASVCIGGINQFVNVAGQFAVDALPQLELSGALFTNATCNNAMGARCVNVSIAIDAGVATMYSSAIFNGNRMAVVQQNSMCTADNEVAITPLPVASVVSVTPNRVCAALPTQIVVVGSGFSTNPAAIVVLPQQGNIMWSGGVVTNTSITVNTTAALVSQVTAAETSITVGVLNGVCTSTTPMLLSVVPVPVVTSVNATLVNRTITTVAHVCVDRPALVSISGTGFVTSTMFPIGVALVPVSNGSTFNVPFASMNVTSTLVSVVLPSPRLTAPPQITFPLSANALAAGTYNVEVTNVAGCASANNGATTQLFVDPVVQVYSLAPSIMWKGMNASVSVYVAGNVPTALGNAVLSFAVSPTSSDLTASGVTAHNSFTGAFDTGATFASALAPGAYYARFTTALGCQGTSTAPAFTVLASTDATPTVSVYPPAGNASTEVLVTASDKPFGFGTVLYGLLSNSATAFPLLRSHLVGNSVRAETPASLMGVSTNMLTIFAVDSLNNRVLMAPNSFLVSPNTINTDVVHVAPSIVPAGNPSAAVLLQMTTQLNVSDCSLQCFNPPATGTCTFEDLYDTYALANFDSSKLTAGQYCRVLGKDNNQFMPVQSRAFAVVSASGAPAAALANVSNALSAPRYGACGVVTRVAPRRGTFVPQQFLHVVGGSTANSVSASPTPGTLVETAPLVDGAAPVFSVSRALTTAAFGAVCAQLGNTVYAIGGVGGSSLVVQAAHVQQAVDAPLLDGALQFGVSGAFTSNASVAYTATYTFAPEGETLQSNVVELNVLAGAATVVAWSSAASRTPASVTIYRSTGGGAFLAIAVATGISGTYIDMNGAPLALNKAPPNGPITDWFGVTVSGGSNVASGAIAGADGNLVFVLSGSGSTTQQLTMSATGTQTVTFAPQTAVDFAYTNGAVASAQWVDNTAPPLTLLFTSGSKLVAESGGSLQLPSVSVSTGNNFGCATATATNASASMLYTFAGASTGVDSVSFSLPRTVGAVTATGTAFPDYAQPACLDADGRYFVGELSKRARARIWRDCVRVCC
jgi:hypothetical protein